MFTKGKSIRSNLWGKWTVRRVLGSLTGSRLACGTCCRRLFSSIWILAVWYRCMSRLRARGFQGCRYTARLQVCCSWLQGRADMLARYAFTCRGLLLCWGEIDVWYIYNICSVSWARLRHKRCHLEVQDYGITQGGDSNKSFKINVLCDVISLSQPLVPALQPEDHVSFPFRRAFCIDVLCVLC